MTVITEPAAAAPAVTRTFRRIACGLSALFAAALARRAAARAEAELRDMSERELHDIGLTRADIRRVIQGELPHDRTRRPR